MTDDLIKHINNSHQLLDEIMDLLKKSTTRMQEDRERKLLEDTLTTGKNLRLEMLPCKYKGGLNFYSKSHAKQLLNNS